MSRASAPTVRKWKNRQVDDWRPLVILRLGFFLLTKMLLFFIGRDHRVAIGAGLLQPIGSQRLAKLL